MVEGIPQNHSPLAKYWINPCQPADVKGCKSGSICLKQKGEVYSLGTIKNGIYDFDHDELIVHYTNGDRCEKHGGQTNYSSEIHFECDPNTKGDAGIGKPHLFAELPCHPVFTWRTSAVCDKVNLIRSLSTSHQTVWLVSLFFIAIGVAVAFLWKPHRRERLRQATSSFVQKFVAPNTRMDETNLLVTSNVTVPTFDEMPSSSQMSFGRLSDEDDDELIIA